MLKINKTLIFFSFPLYFFISFFLNINSVIAAEINFSPTSGTYHVGDTIKVKVIISSDKSVNAVSSNIYFPFDILSLTSLSKSSSIVNLWAQEPSYSNNTGLVNFEGVILNGYTGNSGNILTLVFKIKKVGTANLYFKDVSILANDGNATDIFSGNLKTAILNIEKEIKKEIKVDKPVLDQENEKTIQIIEKVADKIEEVEVINKLPNHSLLVTIIILLIILLIILILFIFYLLIKIKRHFKDKLFKAENVIYKNFKNLKNKINIASKEKNIYKNNGIIKLEKKNSVLKDVVETESNIIKEIEKIKD